MVTVNNRVKIPRAIVINGVDAGGAMEARLRSGYENIMRSAPDGLEVPLKDKEVQFVRGTITTQDWVDFVNLLTGAVGTYVFHERKSGVVEATGYVTHTITNPVIHRARMTFVKGQYAGVTFDFECKAADETKGIADMWTPLDDQAAPAYITAARGGYRVTAAVFDTDVDEIDIYHITRFEFGITMPIDKACNDSDVGYTCVDARLEGLMAEGSIAFQDAAITAGALLCQQLVTHAKDQLKLTVQQGQGATAKNITILGVDFNSAESNSRVEGENPFTEYTLDFDVANDTTTQLTLADTNKIIAIADAV